MTKTFGKHVRRQREALLTLDPQFGLRQTAVRIGVEPSYLSKVERGIGFQGQAKSPAVRPVRRKNRNVAFFFELDPIVLYRIAATLMPDTLLTDPRTGRS